MMRFPVSVLCAHFRIGGVLLLTALVLVPCSAAFSDPWADASPAVSYGPGAGFGQAYYPDNILGPPDPGATPTLPSSSPSELLTLGDAGWVVLQFTDNRVVDGEGVDFTVFENVMQSGSSYFRETAFVDVSQDGETWFRFPWDAVTLEGLAGVWPTTGGDPTNPEVSGGDQFDLHDLGLDWITFVRLTDCSGEVADGGLFDLDAVVAVNSEEMGIEGSSPELPEILCVNPSMHHIELEVPCEGTIRVYGLDGRLEVETRIHAGSSTVGAEGRVMSPGMRIVVFEPSGIDGKVIARTAVL